MWAWTKRFSGTPAQLPNPKQQSLLSSCPTCTILLQQLDEARKREARLSRQLETKDAQVGMVLQSKFETVHLSSENTPENSTGSVLPLDSLMDVNVTDDTEYINRVASMTKH
jgi:hypothetical protein